ncbi:MAG: hypothetical protein ACK5S6_05425 [bacterium]|jgi:hypothetical protein
MNISYEFAASAIAFIFLVMEIRTLRHRVAQLETEALNAEHDLQYQWDYNNERWSQVSDNLQNIYQLLGKDDF